MKDITVNPGMGVLNYIGEVLLPNGKLKIFAYTPFNSHSHTSNEFTPDMIINNWGPVTYGTRPEHVGLTDKIMREIYFLSPCECSYIFEYNQSLYIAYGFEEDFWNETDTERIQSDWAKWSLYKNDHKLESIPGRLESMEMPFFIKLEYQEKSDFGILFGDWRGANVNQRILNPHLERFVIRDQTNGDIYRITARDYFNDYFELKTNWIAYS